MGFLQEHFSLRDIVQTKLADGYQIVITTDVPCHLWMRWTTTKPQIHSEPVLRRGIQMHTDVRFCFVAFQDNEQEEAGDTSIHTFIKHNWPHCQTRYFYFTGTMFGQPVKSTTAIFEKHFEKVGVEYEITIDADHQSIYWFPFNPDWDTVRELPTAPGFEGVFLLYLRSYHWAGNYHIGRNGLRFDTTPIPADASILEAHLDLYCTRVRNYNSSELHILYTAAHEWNSGYVGEFGDMLAYTDLASPAVPPDDIPINEYTSFEFNELGKTMIHNAIGLPSAPVERGTVVPLRMRFDVEDITPGDNATGGGSIDHAGPTHMNPPRLYVKYLA